MSNYKNEQLNIGVLLYGCGHHQAAWLMEDSSIEQIGEISYYQSLAQLSENGLLDAVFFADNQSFPAKSDSELPTFWLDPIINLTAISQVTHHIGLVSTISSSFSNPYTVARQLLTLDHATNGRVGWNLVTSMSDLEAQNHSMQALPSHDKRYQKANEFAELMDKLFTSWKKEDFIHDRDNNQVIKHDQIKSFNHSGEHFQVNGPLSTPSSPQGKPVAMQAGASKQGIALAVKHADAVYSVSWNLKQAKAYRTKLNDAIQQSSTPNKYIKVFPGLVTYIAETREAALLKKEKLDKRLPIENAIKQLSTFVRQDCTKWALDEPVPALPPVEAFDGPVGRYETILEIIEDTQPTVRELLGYLNAGGGHLTLIGTPVEIVDEMERWFKLGVADGFNLMPPTLPYSLEDFVELIVPELQRRGLYREAYFGHTFKEHLNIN
ncbi:NtaA/DmoA family FMN-dependent monooxygenase [Mammaliicoccus vitulinus]|uniref:NtaA/DmoA family FMN-dependent monooxygenase n=1 Tax=Mammaliicoccus vitulinus TaxID=71237 RepID=UPI003B9F955E